MAAFVSADTAAGERLPISGRLADRRVSPVEYVFSLTSI